MVQVAFIPEKRIEAASERLLADFGQRFHEIAEPPVPIESILEAHLELSLEFADLRDLLKIDDVLGATYIEDGRVVISQHLDPTDTPGIEGRYRFTLAHEIGHWVLHRVLFQRADMQCLLFDDQGKPAIVCRTNSKKEAVEIQADKFAGALLMPRKLVLDAWVRLYGEGKKYVDRHEVPEWAGNPAPKGKPQIPIQDEARELAQRFSVSVTAMQIRLEKMGLIVAGREEPDLFSGR